MPLEALNKEIELLEFEIEKLKQQRNKLLIRRRNIIRTPNVTPLILDYLFYCKHNGVSAKEMEEIVKEQRPTVANKSVRSLLSRLKQDGAITYVNGRYYIPKFPPMASSIQPDWPMRPGQPFVKNIPNCTKHR